MSYNPDVNPATFKRVALITSLCGLAFLCSVLDGHCEEKKTAFKLTAASYAVLAGVDVAQSVPCLSSTRCREVSPVYKSSSPAGFIAIKAAGVTTFTVLAWKLKKQHPKWAWGLLAGVTATQGAVVLWNAQHGGFSR